MSDQQNETGAAGGGESAPADATTGAVADAGSHAAGGAPQDALPNSADEFEQLAQEGFADDGDFDEHYRLLFASTAIFVASVCLPIEGRWPDLYARHSIAGGFLTVFSAYGILAAWMNIHNRKMIMWPMLFAAVDGLYVTVMREMQLVQAAQAGDTSKMVPLDWVKLAGPGLYVIFFGCLVVLWTLVTGVAKGAKKAKARAEAAKAARATRK